MDAAGARALRFRLEQQEHWRQAEAVRDGSQPAYDPHGDEVQELGEGIRLYWVEQRREQVDGRPAVVARRFCKRLVDGYWKHGELVYELPPGDQTAGANDPRARTA